MIHPVANLHDDPPVIMITAPNPGAKTLDGTHTYVVGADPAYVIDPGPDVPGYQRFVAELVLQRSRNIGAVLLTHGHPDHALGAPRLKELLGAQVWASQHMPARNAESFGVDRRLEDEDTLTVGTDLLQVIHTPGHVRDHVSFWLERSRILFAGDTILGAGTTLIAPPDGDMTSYMDTLARLARLGPTLIAPGHGPPVTNPAATIREYVRHRQAREAQILAALQDGPTTAEELVRRVYTDIDEALHTLALGSVKAQLAKLEREGRVQSSGSEFRLR